MAKTVIHQFIPEYKQFRPWNQTTSDEATKRCVHTVGSADIASLCKGVSKGRGRISACLYAHSNKLSAACQPELAKVTSSSMFERMIPAGIRNLNNTPYEAELRKTCATDIKSHCSSVAPGDDRLLACLYAWGDRVSKACTAEAKTVLDHLK